MKRILICIYFIFTCHIVFSQFAAEFHNENGYIKIEDDTVFHLNEFTVECMIMIKDTGISVISGEDSLHIIPIISRGHEDEEMISGLNFLLGLRKYDHVITADLEASASVSVPFLNYPVTGYTSLQNNLWYHVALTFNGTCAKIYLNGKQEISQEIPEPVLNNTAGDIGIARMFDKNGNPSGAFQGCIDALRIWNYERTQNEIISNMNNEIITPEPGLLISLNLNEEQGSTLNNNGIFTEADIHCNNILRTSGATFEALKNIISDTDPVIKIGLIADPQYSDRDPVGSRYYRYSLNKLRAAIDTLNHHNVDFSITLGDMIDKDFISFDSIMPLYDLFDNPHYFLLGNHEYEYIHDSVKEQVLDKINMPDNYYSFAYENWKFIVVDGTELAGYTRIIHPELADEGDSLWQRIQGQVNAEVWNGGISRTQQIWMKQELEDAYENKQNVIIFGHFMLFPVHAKNLWNNNDIIGIIDQYPNVIAYVNGHFHQGKYGSRDSIHYYTNYAMVETDTINSFSILEIYPDKLKLKGYGYNYDKELSYRNVFKKTEPPVLNGNVIRYNVTPGENVGKINSEIEYQYGFIGDTAVFDNNHFNISNDTLYIMSIPDLLEKNEYMLKIGYIDHEFDTSSVVFSVILDTNFVIQKNMIPDKIIPVHSGFTIDLNSFFIDQSKEGIHYEIEIQHPELISYILEGTLLTITSLNQGNTIVNLILNDLYTNKTYMTGFNITVSGTETSVLHNTECRAFPVIFPNPASEELYVKFINMENKWFEYTIYCQNGSIVINEIIENRSGKNMINRIPVSDLSPGMYYIEFISENERTVNKFFIH